MAGTVTIAVQSHRTIRSVRWTWVSDASGDANATLTDLLVGIPLRVVFIPDTGGTQPTANYDVVIEDADGADILRAQGANRADTYADATEQLTYGDATEPGVFDSTLELKVSNAGNAKGGVVVMYYR